MGVEGGDDMPDDAIQDLVEELLELMDDSQLSLHEQFKALHRVMGELIRMYGELEDDT